MLMPFPPLVVPHQQCKPEYKVPGLYVIDSIVRQSRHQFGMEKDVFAPRFSKNIIGTFQHLYRCPSDDKVRNARNALMICFTCADGPTMYSLPVRFLLLFFVVGIRLGRYDGITVYQGI